MLVVKIMKLLQYESIDIADKKEKEIFLRRINDHLHSHSYLAGDNVTAADVLLYHGIHSLYQEMSYQEKDKLIHLSR